MSDSDDWENAADDILDDKPAEEEKKTATFADEDNVDSDEEREKAKAEAEKKRKEQEEANKANPKSKKNAKKDYEQMYADRMGAGAKKAAAMAAKGQGGEMVSRAAEEDITD